MELTVYNIIRRPIVSNKASDLARNKNKIVLEVHQKANKQMIAQAIEKLFNVKVESVRVVVRKGKVRTFKRVKSMGKTSKRAYITLKPGYSLSEAPGMAPEGFAAPETAKAA